MSDDLAVEAVARAMHDAYEAAAKEVGWETQPSCRVTFDQLPAANRLVMFASARAAIATMPPSSPLLDRDAVIEEIAKWHDGNAALGAIGGSGGTPAQRRSYRANRDLHLSCAKYIRSLKSPTAAKE